MEYKIGTGTDSHRFVSEGPNELTSGKFTMILPKIEGNLFHLGGVNIPNIEVIANSDGDVVYHALYDAISSAMEGKSIGVEFPNDSGPSEKFLLSIKKQMEEKGYKINNISIVIECKKPRITPIEEEIKENLARIFEINKNQIGITAKSGEELTAFGRGEGAEAIVTVLLKQV
ncbi:MAG: 2-C-methyl-D-erythritol 2,4-cyclodiphosphate synthase [Candidatus Micrarchaeia archaeon]|jgi:2-C-methyl-D-erythritol 2,4-cyclodiphosphate synthase